MTSPKPNILNLYMNENTHFIVFSISLIFFEFIVIYDMTDWAEIFKEAVLNDIKFHWNIRLNPYSCSM